MKFPIFLCACVLIFIVIIFTLSAKDPCYLSNENLPLQCNKKIKLGDLVICCLDKHSFAVVKSTNLKNVSVFLSEQDVEIISNAFCLGFCRQLSDPNSFVCCKGNKTTVHQYYAKQRSWKLALNRFEIQALRNFTTC